MAKRRGTRQIRGSVGPRRAIVASKGTRFRETFGTPEVEKVPVPGENGSPYNANGTLRREWQVAIAKANEMAKKRLEHTPGEAAWLAHFAEKRQAAKKRAQEKTSAKKNKQALSQDAGDPTPRTVEAALEELRRKWADVNRPGSTGKH